MKAFIYRLTPSLIHSECVPVMLNYMSEREDDDIDDKMRLCASQYLQVCCTTFLQNHTI